MNGNSVSLFDVRADGMWVPVFFSIFFFGSGTSSFVDVVS